MHAPPPPPRPSRPRAAEANVIALPRDLSTQMDLCWATSGRGESGITLQEFFPDAGAHLVFRHSPAGCRMVLLGPTTERATVERDAGAEYIGIRFRAGQAPRLADVRSSELTDTFVEITQIRGTPIESLAEQMQRLPDLRSRQRALMDWVRDAAPPLVSDVRCRRATLVLEAHGGMLRIDALAGELGLHPRSLERLFLDQLGVSPKRMARLVRLRHVLGALHTGKFATLAELAHACGYADQPHMIRDFKELTDRLPSERDAHRSRQLSRADTRIVHRYRP